MDIFIILKTGEEALGGIHLHQFAIVNLLKHDIISKGIINYVFITALNDHLDKLIVSILLKFPFFLLTKLIKNYAYIYHS